MIATVIIEANLVRDPGEWVVDTSDSCHFCANRDLFKEFEVVVEGGQVYMGNFSIFKVRSRGKIEIKISSRKTLFVQNVLYVSSLRINLISVALLNRVGVKLV